MKTRSKRPIEETELLRMLATFPNQWITTMQLDYFKDLPPDAIFFVPALLSKGEIEFKQLGRWGMIKLTKRGLVTAQALGLAKIP